MRSWVVVVCVLLISTAALGTWAFLRESPTATVDLTTFNTQRASGLVAAVEMGYDSATMRVSLTDGTKEQVRIPSGYGADLAKELTSENIPVTVSEPPGQNVFQTYVIPLMPALLILAGVVWLLRGRGGVGKLARSQRAPVQIPDTRFGDIAGAPELIEDLEDVVSFLRDPRVYERMGARMSRGILLAGPPGVGKTLAARAVAGEAGVPFFAVSGSDFVETFAGVGASRVRELFARARSAGRAIVFIDEIDAVARMRTASASGSTEENERTLNMLLSELDGFSTRDGVFVLAATNRVDILDPALLRPGRFDRTIVLVAPDRRGRERILELYLERHPTRRDIDITALAQRTAGFTGAELENLINQAALIAARERQDAVGDRELERALEAVVMGPERRSRIFDAEDRKIVAWHEAGHAVCAMMTDATQAPARISIVPRGPAGGVTWFHGEDRELVTKSRAEGQLTVLLGGRSAEEVLLKGDVTQGAADDLVKATRLAHTMVSEWGMSSLGAADFDPEVPWRAGDEVHVREETNRLVKAAHERARRIISEHMRLVERLAEELLAEEQLDSERIGQLRAEVESLPPWPPTES